MSTPSSKFTLPLIHSNGTGRAALLREVSAARELIIAAQEAVNSITCHQRDYYPRPDYSQELWDKVVAEKRAAREALKITRAYLDEHYWHLTKGA